MDNPSLNYDAQSTEQLFQAWSKLRCGFFYDIRSIAAEILGRLELILHQLPLPEQENEHVNKCISYAKRLLCIHDWYDFLSIVDALLSKGTHIDTDYHFPQEIAGEIKAKWPGKLEVIVSDKVPHFRADGTNLKAIMLLSINLLVAKDKESFGWLRVESNENRVIFRFGIFDFVIPDYFIKANEIALRMTSPISTEYGLSLKLAFIYFWMRLHGGDMRIVLDSKDGECIRFLLPADQETAAT
jgi:hypothetical protein